MNPGLPPPATASHKLHCGLGCDPSPGSTGSDRTKGRAPGRTWDTRPTQAPDHTDRLLLEALIPSFVTKWEPGVPIRMWVDPAGQEGGQPERRMGSGEAGPPEALAVLLLPLGEQQVQVPTAVPTVAGPAAEGEGRAAEPRVPGAVLVQVPQAAGTGQHWQGGESATRLLLRPPVAPPPGPLPRAPAGVPHSKPQPLGAGT